MKGLAILGAAALLLTSGASAMDGESAEKFLQGTWLGASETWLFDGQSWTQYNGGVTTEGTYTVEQMPENLFVVISGATGKRYVVHTSSIAQSMAWFDEGSTRQVGFYTRAPAE